jgi:hypothetical protein
MLGLFNPFAKRDSIVTFEVSWLAAIDPTVMLIQGSHEGLIFLEACVGSAKMLYRVAFVTEEEKSLQALGVPHIVIFPELMQLEPPSRGTYPAFIPLVS